MKKWKQNTGLVIIFALFLLCLLCMPSALVASGSHSTAGEMVASGAANGVVVQDSASEHSAVKGHGGHDGHGDADMLSRAKLKDFGWRIVNFIALLIILVKFGAKPLGNALSGRRSRIVSEIDELERRKDEAQKAYQEFQGKLASVEADIDRIVERAVAQAEVEKAKILEKAEAAAEEMKRSAEQAVQNEVAEARKILREEVAEKAAVMAEEIIRQNLKANDQKTIIENYLARVGAMS